MHKNGAMSFKIVAAFNLVMLDKQSWKFMTDRNALASRLLKAICFSRISYLDSNTGHTPSFAWRSI